MESYIFFSVFLVPRNPLKPASRVTSRRSVGDGPEGPADAFQWANKSSRRSGGPASILGSQIPARKPTVFGWCEKNLVNNKEKTKISSKKGLIERKPLGFCSSKSQNRDHYRPPTQTIHFFKGKFPQIHHRFAWSLIPKKKWWFNDPCE